MDLRNYPSNSNASRIQRSNEPAPERRVDIPEGRAVEQSWVKRTIRNIIVKDFKSVAEDIMDDVILPSFKNLLSDMASNFIDGILFGGPSNSRRYSKGGPVNYSGIYSGGLKSSRVIRLNEEKDERPLRGGTSSYAFQDISLSKPEGDEVLYILRSKEEQYDGLVSVSDVYDAIEEAIGEKVFTNVREFTDNKWGWSDISRARLERVNNGYILRMPAKIEPL